MYQGIFKPIFKGIFREILSTGLGGDKQCWTYLFSSSNTDALSFDTPFIGNVKVKLAAPSETGINPAIIAGRQGDFVASTDPVNNPNWVQYEIEASAIDYIVDATFNGVVGLVGLDDVFYKLDQGAPKSFILTSSFTLTDSFVLRT